SRPHKLVFVKLNLDSGSQAECHSVLRFNVGNVWTAGNIGDPGNLAAYYRIVREVVKLQNLLQSFTATDNGESIQCQMGYQPPLQPSSNGRSNGAARLLQAADIHHQRRLQVEPVLRIHKWSVLKITIGAGEMHRQYIAGYGAGPEVEVHK